MTAMVVISFLIMTSLMGTLFNRIPERYDEVEIEEEAADPNRKPGKFEMKV